MLVGDDGKVETGSRERRRLCLNVMGLGRVSKTEGGPGGPGGP